MQGLEFALSLIRSSLFLFSLICSKLLIVKSDREHFAHVALYKRVNRSLLSLKKSDVSDSLLIRIFHMFFTFFPLFRPKRELLPSLFAHSLFLKERLHSRRSLQTSDCERFALVALFTSDCFFAFLLSTNEQIAQQIYERIPNPDAMLEAARSIVMY